MTKIGFQDQLSLNAGQKYCRMLQEEHSAILSTFIKLPFVVVFVWSIFELPIKTGFTVTYYDETKKRTGLNNGTNSWFILKCLKVCYCVKSQTVNSEIHTRILFLGITLKMFVLISKRQNDFSISQAVYENKTLTKTSEQTVGSDFSTLMKNSSTFNFSH